MEIFKPSTGKEALIKANRLSNPSITFEVSEVAQANKPLPEVPYYYAIAALVKKSVSQWHFLDIVEALAKKLGFQWRSQRVIEACSQYRDRLVADVQYHPVVAELGKSSLPLAILRRLCL